MQAVHHALNDEMKLQGGHDVEAYLARLLEEFVHFDRLFGIRDAAGRRVESVAEMVMEGDIRLNAESFERERAVHRHIGDFLLFWNGVFPEFLSQLRLHNGKDVMLDPVRQGQMSYYVASTFDYDPYTEEAAIFRKLSDRFEEYCHGLRIVRASFEGLRA
jgi:hypothetical protein